MYCYFPAAAISLLATTDFLLRHKLLLEMGESILKTEFLDK